MHIEILYSPEALADLRRRRAYNRRIVLHAIGSRLRAPREEPVTGMVKKLRPPAPTTHRLRGGEWRVMSKPESVRYLRAHS